MGYCMPCGFLRTVALPAWLFGRYSISSRLAQPENLHNRKSGTELRCTTGGSNVNACCQMRKSSVDLPLASPSAIHFGWRLRPVQVWLLSPGF